MDALTPPAWGNIKVIQSQPTDDCVEKALYCDFLDRKYYLKTYKSNINLKIKRKIH